MFPIHALIRISMSLVCPVHHEVLSELKTRAMMFPSFIDNKSSFACRNQSKSSETSRLILILSFKYWQNFLSLVFVIIYCISRNEFITKKLNIKNDILSYVGLLSVYLMSAKLPADHIVWANLCHMRVFASARTKVDELVQC